MRTLGFVFARGGSKGISRKNLQEIGGLPLVAHSILIAKQLSEVERVVVSTDDEEIARVSEKYGAEVPFLRPSEISGDTSSEFLAWQHAVEQIRLVHGHFDVMLSLPATAPLRSVGDIRLCLDELQRHKSCDVVLTGQKAQRSPFFNMVSRNAEGFCQILVLGEKLVRRQDAPEAFDLCTVAYAVRTEFLSTATSLFEGKVRLVEIPRERALDIDEPLDLEIARFLYKRAGKPPVP